MKNIIILIIQLCGYAFILVSIVSFLNFMFGWSIGFKGEQIPAEPEFAIVFLVLGLITSAVGWFLNKKFSV